MSESIAEKHTLYSSIREEYIEYVFLSEICSNAWAADKFISIARSQTDAFGYDVILTCDGMSRHVQLKAMAEGGKASFQKVNTGLSKAPSGCVVWLIVDRDRLQIKSIGWFGAKPGKPLPDLGDEIAMHNKGNKDGLKKERPNIRKVKKSRFEWLDNTDQLICRLFEQ
ncbi:hypothetical protein [Sulfitobacter sp. JB4-11]|uniref:hypothetical protein n=1 Tax=Sulfitobacter rhodophyticola TaxID=3238304 RepID=UPI0035136A2B